MKETYAPSDPTDVATLCQKISELTDLDDGGFLTKKFTDYWCALSRAGHEPDAAICTVRVLGIK